MTVVAGMTPISYWENSDEWVGPKDLAIALTVARRFGPACEVLEVGVWKGGWSLHMAMNLRLGRVSAIDPYPGLPEVREATLGRLAHAGVELALHASWEELPSALFHVVHVDGEHSEEAALRDLLESDARLSPQGIIIVDDWLTPHFPGVNSAVHAFLRERGYRIVALTEFKVYLTRAADTADWADWLGPELRRIPGLPPIRDRASAGLGGAYDESAAVLGHEPFVCLGKPGPELKPGRPR